MKEAARALEEIGKRRKHGARPMLFLDFDGTLSPIVRRPNAAKLPKKTRDLLVDLSKRIPVAIISGRDLADLEARVGIEGISYAGCHGLEWKIDGKRHEKRPDAPHMRALRDARAELLALAPRSSGLVVEDKRFSFALNYRALSDERTKHFERDARAAILPFQSKLRLLDELRTFEILPKMRWNKGECARSMLRSLRQSDASAHFPIYLGDSETDEDAFRVLNKGICIRVGNNSKSAARYYVRSQSSVEAFLSKLARLK